MSNFQLYYNTTCCPDYFRGHSGLVLAVPVHHGMTYTELFGELKRELIACDYGLEAYGFTWEMLHNMVHAWIKGTKADIEGETGLDACTTSFYENSEHDEQDDDADDYGMDRGDSCFAYFIVTDAD